MKATEKTTNNSFEYRKSEATMKFVPYRYVCASVCMNGPRPHTKTEMIKYII